MSNINATNKKRLELKELVTSVHHLSLTYHFAIDMMEMRKIVLLKIIKTQNT